MVSDLTHVKCIARDMKRGERTWTLDDYRWTVDRLLEYLDPEFLEKRGRFVAEDDVMLKPRVIQTVPDLPEESVLDRMWSDILHKAV